ncbi:MAG TPA: DinB family protein [Acidobacteriota bacterium]|nr:DinB family protein [Acidobacteriota bacterium]
MGRKINQHTADRYRRWFQYEKDSHAKVLASLKAVDFKLRSSRSFQKALDLMAHILAARRLWLFRFGVTQEAVSELFPHGVTLDDLTNQVHGIQHAWTSYLDRLDDVELTRVFEYQSLEGEWYRNIVEDILTQLFGHSWYHRGQIAALIRSIGAEPAVTDFVFWAREPIEPPS